MPEGLGARGGVGVLRLPGEGVEGALLHADAAVHAEGPVDLEPVEDVLRPLAGAGRGRVRTENVLDRFAIDWSLCMYCGICVEECPFDALAWSPDLASPAETLGALTAEKADLSRVSNAGSG